MYSNIDSFVDDGQDRFYDQTPWSHNKNRLKFTIDIQKYYISNVFALDTFTSWNDSMRVNLDIVRLF